MLYLIVGFGFIVFFYTRVLRYVPFRRRCSFFLPRTRCRCRRRPVEVKKLKIISGCRVARALLTLSHLITRERRPFRRAGSA